MKDPPAWKTRPTRRHGTDKPRHHTKPTTQQHNSTTKPAHTNHHAKSRLGRPAIYRGDPSEVAFTNSLLRFVAGDSVLPEFALLVFRRHMRAGRFKRESRITTNIAHLSASRLKPIEFPIPSLDEQAQIAQEAEDRLGEIKRLRAALDAAMLRSRQLRRIALSAALTGGLKPAGGQSDRILEDA